MTRFIAFALAILALSFPAVAAPKLGGYTTMTYSPGHGTQVEYYANDGTNYLWYPGNRVVLPGNWKRDGADLCFRYGGNTYNPVTGHNGGGWECMPYKLQLTVVVDQAKGDIFGLAKRRTVPFSLPKARTTLAALAGKEKPQPKGAEADGDVQSPIGSCSEILANQDRSKTAMVYAARLYFHGMLMGKKCGKVDYVKAFDLLARANDKATAQAFIRILKERASTGNPRAISALKAIGAE